MNREFESIDAFEVFLTHKSEQTVAAINETASVSTRLIGEYAHDVFGHDPPLATLSETTQDIRQKAGYTRNDPLVRDGSLLRNALEVKLKKVVRQGRFDVAEAGAGSAEKIQLYHELGYINHRTGRPVPPRPVFQITAKAVGPEIAELFSGEIKRVFGD